MKFYCEVCEKDVDIEGYKKNIILDFKKRQSDIQLFCPNNNKHFKIIRARELAKVPLEKKQEFMNLIKKGMKLGDARQIVDISLDVACDILNNQIESISIINFEVKQ